MWDWHSGISRHTVWNEKSVWMCDCVKNSSYCYYLLMCHNHVSEENSGVLLLSSERTQDDNDDDGDDADSDACMLT